MFMKLLREFCLLAALRAFSGKKHALARHGGLRFTAASENTAMQTV
jgi:hypothetical protein